MRWAVVDGTLEKGEARYAIFANNLAKKAARALLRVENRIILE
jgi:hypothetical protein